MARPLTRLGVLWPSMPVCCSQPGIQSVGPPRLAGGWFIVAAAAASGKLPCMPPAVQCSALELQSVRPANLWMDVHAIIYMKASASGKQTPFVCPTNQRRQNRTLSVIMQQCRPTLLWSEQGRPSPLGARKQPSPKSHQPLRGSERASSRRHNFAHFGLLIHISREHL